MPVEIQRIYDGAKKRHKKVFRVFVDRLWAKGIKKEEAGVDLWLKDVAPSSQLRKWFGHDHSKWNQFKKRYFKELDSNQDSVAPLLQKLHSGTTLLLLYGSKDEEFNNAVALREYLLERLASENP